MKINIRNLLGLPTKSNELTYWGTLDFKAGKYEAALRYFNKAFELNPESEFIKERINETINKIESKNVKMSSNMEIEYSSESSTNIENVDMEEIIIDSNYLISSNLENNKSSWDQRTVNLDESQKKRENKLSTNYFRSVKS